MKYNDFDMQNWKEIESNTDSLWIIKERDKSGKHKNVYHGNFIPQVPNELIKRYTNKNDLVFEPFMGSGTTLFECENLDRRYIGFDINPEMIDYVETAMSDDTEYSDYHISNCNSLNTQEVDKNFNEAFEHFKSKSCQFALLHPPYMDIVKFTENENDLSSINDLDIFLDKFKLICENTLKHLDKNRYFAIVIGDVYKNSEVIPLSFYCMNMIKQNFKVKLKGTIVKNIEGSRGKLGVGGIWRYRALSSDYYIFKHEYIFVFKKEF